MPRSPVKILTRKDIADADSKHLGVLRRPWIRIRTNRIPDRVMVMAKRNSKVYADLGLSTKFMVRFLTVLDTGTEPNFVVESILPPAVQSQIRRGVALDAADAGNNPLETVGVIDLVVRLGPCVVKLHFIVCRSLPAPLILGCDFCDRFVEAVVPRLKRVELDDGSSVPIVSRPPKRASKKHVPLPAAQEFPAAFRESTTLRVDESICIPKKSHSWVRVSSRQHGTRTVRPIPSLSNRHQLAFADGMVHIEPNKSFGVCVSNSGEKHRYLVRNQVIARVAPHPMSIFTLQGDRTGSTGMGHSEEGDNLVGGSQSTLNLSTLPCVSPPAVLVKLSNGSWIVVIDYRRFCMTAVGKIPPELVNFKA
ncbi:unnamed protein product [Agarophyton chilense]